MKVCVFLGPTLAVEEARAVLDAIYLPPVSQGDVYRAALERPGIIGIIDGFFDHVPAVWHKEILWAISQGIRVYGSASMGALRAAELVPFGMTGVGRIFSAYREGLLEDDDEVAVAHAAVQFGYRQTSEAMVNIRATLARAESEKVISSDTRLRLETIAKQLFYPERNYRALLQKANESRLPADEVYAFEQWLPRGRVDQKREDALSMLTAIREDLSQPFASRPVSFQLERTVYWERLVQSAGGGRPSSAAVDPPSMLALLLGELRLDPRLYVRLSEGALIRHLLREEAQRRGIRVEPEAVATIAGEFRRGRGLLEEETFLQWLDSNGLRPEQFADFIRDEVSMLRVRELLRPEVLRGLVDELRSRGRYRHFTDRSREKQRLLEAHGLADVGAQDLGVTPEALLDWYLRQLPPASADDTEAYLELSRFADEDPHGFTHVLSREYCYRELTQLSGKGRSEGACPTRTSE